MSFTKEEIQTLGDLNYLARTVIKPPADVVGRLMVLAYALKAGTYRQWTDPDRSYILGLMASTADGKYWRALLDRFAADIGATIQEVVTATAPPVNSTPSTGLPLRAPAGTISRREAMTMPSVNITESLMSEMEIDAQVIDYPVAFMNEVGIGGAPLAGHALTLRKSGEIVCLETVESDKTQEKSGPQIRAGAFHLNPYDGGMGMVQGGFWHNGVLHRSRPDINMVKFDSRGELSLNFEDYVDGKVERGQAFVIHIDRENRRYVLSFRRAGWGLDIACNTDSGNDHNPNLDDRRIELVAPTDGVRNVDDLRR